MEYLKFRPVANVAKTANELPETDPISRISHFSRPSDSEIALDGYLALLTEDAILTEPDLPPIPPRNLSSVHRAIAWAAWWTAVDRQRKRRARMN